MFGKTTLLFFKLGSEYFEVTLQSFVALSMRFQSLIRYVIARKCRLPPNGEFGETFVRQDK